MLQEIHEYVGKNIWIEIMLSQENFLRGAQNNSSPALPELADAVK